MSKKQYDYQNIKLEYIDRKTLRTLRARFTDINNGRLYRTSQGLNDNQRSFFHSLALMLHINHPLLPGYVSKNTPAAISGFIPDKAHILSLKKLFKTFEYKHQAIEEAEIHSIFLMGSTGSVAHAGGSDMDIWICHKPGISPERMAMLVKKLDQISTWAKKEVALDVCFFPMNADLFKNGGHESAVGDEDCGSAQHYLLLDEFYRSGLLLEGRYPMWWLISPDIEEHYDEYVNFILERKFIGDDEAIDFGRIPTIPAGEFVGAGIWQLYKAIDSPYKSVVKIMLTEAYAAEYPNVVPVSMVFKRMVHDGIDELNALDPYMLVYKKIELYLQNSNTLSRLELARQCFYLKTKVDASKIKKNETNWRRKLMHEVTQSWGWDQELLLELDKRIDWNIQEVITRKKLLVREMNASYRFLLAFAKKFKSEVKINTADISILGRKLHAAFERKRGKIEKVNPKIAPDITEESLTFILEEDQDPALNVWNIYSGPLNQIIPGVTSPIKRSRSMIELLAWSYFNKVYFGGSHLQIQAPNVSVQKTTEAYEIIEKHFPEKHKSTKLEAFNSPSTINKFLIMAEFTNPATYDIKFEKGFNYSDPFNQSTNPPAAINLIDVITTNTWNETVCYNYSGTEAIIQCLVQILMDLPPPDAQFDINVEVGSNHHRDIIKPRIERILGEFFICFHQEKHANHARFIIEIGNQIYGIQPRQDNVFTKKFRNTDALTKWLSEPQPVFSPVIFETYTQPQSSINLAAKYNSPDTIQVHYEIFGNKAEVIIFDEMGSLYTYTTGFSSDQHFIAHTYRFLRAIKERQELSKMELMDTDLSKDEIEFYEIFTDFRKRSLVASKQNIFHHIEQEVFTEIIAILDQSSDGQTSYKIYCDELEFSDLEFGANLYLEVAQYVKSLRNPNSSNYPIYLTDLDMSGLHIANSASSSLQITQYLHYKQEIESILNNSLNKLL
ncbi:MAG TPA: hypothetical protein DHW71_04130 [Gammaproteobacteria bacterium]|nr:hypothetical protein [Gammaproteobacteria bacterium]